MANSTRHYAFVKTVVSCLLLALGGAPSFAQQAGNARASSSLDSSRAIHHYVHKIWTTEDGLPSDTVFDIVQTPDGYLWLATNAGLARFDGVRFKTFDTQSTPGLPTNVLTKLCVTRDGTLWIGSNGGGLVRYQDREFSTLTAESGLAGDIIEDLLEDREGVLWIVAAGEAHRLEDGRLSLFERPQEVAAGWVNSVAEGADGTFWFTTRNQGFIRWQRGQWRLFTSADGLPAGPLLFAYEDRAGALWLAGSGPEPGRLFRYSDGRFVDHSRDNDGPIGRAAALLESRDGTVWFAFSGGVRRFVDERFETHRFEPGTNQRFKALFEDREGSLWMGTYAGGLQRFTQGPITTYSALDGLDSMVFSIFEDRSQNLWVGANGGLSRFENGRFEPVADVPFPVRAMAEDEDGALWLGTSDALLRYADGELTRFATDRQVSLVFADRQDGLHVGLWRAGLVRFRAGTLSVVEELPSQWVRWAHRDRRGALLFATNERGLLRMEDDQATWVTKVNGLSSDAVLSFHEDDDGALWIGTEGGGLNRLKDGVIAHYSSSDGLHDDTLWPILEDDRDNLWMGGDRGIFRVSKQDLADFDAGKIPMFPSVVYGVADGLKDLEGVGMGDPSGWRTRDGRLWFATMAGVAMIDPNRLGVEAPPPPVVIEEILIDGEELDGLDPLEVPAEASEIEIRFTALSFAKTDQIQFQCRIDGDGRPWRNVGTRRTATYTNLPPRDYRFQVRARHPNGEWSENVAELGLAVLPSWWQTWWFRAAVLLVAIALAGGASRLRVHSVTQRNRALLRRAAEQEAARVVMAETEALTRATLDSLAAQIAVLDTNGNIVRVNETWQRLHRTDGAGPDLIEGVGLNYLEVLPRASGASSECAKSIRSGLESLLDGSTDSFDLEYPRGSSKNRRWFRIRGVPLVSGEKGVVLSHVDITDRKLAEIERTASEQKARQQREELTHVQRIAAMGELVGAMSHEINQPLTAILSNTQAAHRLLQLPEPDLAEIGEILEDVSDDNRRASEIMRGLHGLLKKQPVAAKPLDVNEVVGELAELLHSDAILRRVTLSLELEDELPPVNADRVQIQQVLLNLTMNGFEALAQAEASERVVVLRTARAPEAAVHVSVEDSGPGLGDRDSEELFKAFETTKPNGLGMGLSIARSIVEAHGGRIWAESNPGQGATFHFTLPATLSTP